MYFKTVQQAWSRSFFQVKLRIQSEVSSFLFKKFYSGPRKDLLKDYISITRVLHYMPMYDSLDKSDLCCSFTKGKGKLGHSINFQFRLSHFTKVLVCRCRSRLLRVKAVFSPRMLQMKQSLFPLYFRNTTLPMHMCLNYFHNSVRAIPS